MSDKEHYRTLSDDWVVSEVEVLTGEMRVNMSQFWRREAPWYFRQDGWPGEDSSRIYTDLAQSHLEGHHG